jgi:lipopolysaccharide export system permease protein
MDQSTQQGLNLVSPGRFIRFGSNYTIYAGGQSPDHMTLLDVFAHRTEADGSDTVIVGKEAISLIDPAHQNLIVEVHNGRQYKMKPGQLRYFTAQFATYRLHLNDAQAVAATTMSAESTPTDLLLNQPDNPHALAEFGYRLCMPLMILFAIILALPLSQVSPRQGRYLRLFPALLLFVALVIGVVAMKLRVGKGAMSAWWYAGLMLFYLFFTLLIARKQRLTARFASKSPRPPQGGTPSLVEGNA